ncbi:hypothetical protein RHRU231_470258 [Rhodococcus ruber]|uniref:Uncharacterized protein n=1 Tax=Rhodococcus ruber TaxID=1830 RepID=A0A098BMG3_9NOCA|nr:hypothetical protein RHRU231_470258 [Rhodococcus ruber]
MGSPAGTRPAEAGRPGTEAVPGLPGDLWRWAVSDRGARPGAGVAALEGTTLVLAHAAPHARVLTGLEGPREALGGDGAAVAHELGVGDLREGRAAVTDGEEQLGILVAADGLVAPVHASTLLR